MDAYIAKDKDDRLFIHFNEPKMNIQKSNWQSYPYSSMICIDNSPLAEQFTDLSFEDGPVRIKIKI